jgi:predicted MFS family arabinose efflux permease
VVFARWVRGPLVAMLSAGAFAIALADIGFALAPSLILACAAAFVGGLGNGVELPSLISVVQRLTPQRLQGQMMGAVESLNALCVAIGLPIGGALVVFGSPRIAFVVIGVGTAVSAAALFSVGRGKPAADTDGATTSPLDGSTAEYAESLPH